MRLLLHRSGTVHRRFSVISSSEARRQLWSQCSVLAPFCQPRVISLVHQTGESTRFLTPKNILDIDETVTSASSSWYQHLQPCQYQVADARLVAFVAFHFVLLGIFLFPLLHFRYPNHSEYLKRHMFQSLSQQGTCRRFFFWKAVETSAIAICETSHHRWQSWSPKTVDTFASRRP